jgi:hypothetical protein
VLRALEAPGRRSFAFEEAEVGARCHPGRGDRDVTAAVGDTVAAAP